MAKVSQGELAERGRRLRAYRMQAGLSQAEAARGVCTQAALSNYEAGKRDMPAGTAVGLARRFGVLVDALLFADPMPA